MLRREKRLAERHVISVRGYQEKSSGCSDELQILQPFSSILERTSNCVFELAFYFLCVSPCIPQPSISGTGRSPALENVGARDRHDVTTARLGSSRELRVRGVGGSPGG